MVAAQANGYPYHLPVGFGKSIPSSQLPCTNCPLLIYGSFQPLPPAFAHLWQFPASAPGLCSFWQFPASVPGLLPSKHFLKTWVADFFKLHRGCLRLPSISLSLQDS